MRFDSPVRVARPALDVLDQTRLPHEEVWLSLRRVGELCEAVRSLRVRGAPLLGVCGAGGVAIAAEELGVADAILQEAAEQIADTRPTAVELRTGAELALATALARSPRDRADTLWTFARDYLSRRRDEDARLASLGAGLLDKGSVVLTRCNTGMLATGGIGTALGVIRVAFEQGRLSHCYATETRPLLQGARLTAWELKQAAIPSSLVPDTAAAALLGTGKVSAVITGADRIAMNGDTANKVGTYGLAAVAARHGVPFYVAAPRSTFDPGCPTGEAIPIEFRSPDEVGGFGGQRWSPDGLGAFNPAFDVTPAELITAFITEAGIARPPFGSSFRALLAQP